MHKLLTKFQQLPVIRDISLVFNKFSNDDGPRYSAALTYTSLFAVVPMLTVIYSMLAALPVFRGVGDELEMMLFDHLVPTTGEVIQDYMANFAQQARQLTLMGVTTLIITAGLMIVNIEKAFNSIFRVEKQRKGLQAFLIYWAALSLGPLTLGAALVLNSYLTTLPLLATLDGYTGGNITSLWRLLPFVMSGLAFTLMYWAIPNCRVKFSHAVQGGFAMAILFETAKRGFSWFVTSFPSYEFIYGAFAAFPLFLLWVYISWTLILFCAQWVALQGLKEDGLITSSNTQGKKLNPSLQIILILYQIWLAFGKAEGVQESQISRLISVKGAEDWKISLSWLEENNWAVFNSTKQAWYPARDFNQANLTELVNNLPWALPAVADWPQEVSKLTHLTEAAQKIEEERNKQLEQPVTSFFK